MNKKKKKINKKRNRILLAIFLLTISYVLFHNTPSNLLSRSSDYDKIIMSEARNYDLDPLLVASVIWVESRFDPKAESPKGAIGLMQIMPETGEWIANKMDISHYKDTMLKDPATNIKMGCWYLNYLTKQYNGNIKLALAAYNGGIGNVNHWLDTKLITGKNIDGIPYDETRNYVKQILNIYNKYQNIYEMKEETLW